MRSRRIHASGPRHQCAGQRHLGRTRRSRWLGLVACPEKPTHPASAGRRVVHWMSADHSGGFTARAGRHLGNARPSDISMSFATLLTGTASSLPPAPRSPSRSQAPAARRLASVPFGARRPVRRIQPQQPGTQDSAKPAPSTGIHPTIGPGAAPTARGPAQEAKLPRPLGTGRSSSHRADCAPRPSAATAARRTQPLVARTQ
jgi:hypothetical protein